MNILEAIEEIKSGKMVTPDKKWGFFLQTSPFGSTLCKILLDIYGKPHPDLEPIEGSRFKFEEVESKMWELHEL